MLASECQPKKILNLSSTGQHVCAGIEGQGQMEFEIPLPGLEGLAC